MKPSTHGFWVMLLFAVSLAVLKAIGDEAFATLRSNVGEIIAALLIIVPAWYWLQFIARAIKVTCPHCGARSMRFTGRFPLTRTFHCDACGADYEMPRPGSSADD